jgi:hypothetical protein
MFCILILESEEKMTRIICVDTCSQTQLEVQDGDVITIDRHDSFTVLPRESVDADPCGCISIKWTPIYSQTILCPKGETLRAAVQDFFYKFERSPFDTDIKEKYLQAIEEYGRHSQVKAE